MKNKKLTICAFRRGSREIDENAVARQINVAFDENLFIRRSLHSKPHNSAQFRHFPMISKLTICAFRRGSREIDENAVARQISVVLMILCEES